MHQGKVMRSSAPRTGLAFGAMLVIAAFTLPVAADAPIAGPDKQYDDFSSSAKSITDRFTHLVWDRPSVNPSYPSARNFAAAKASCLNTTRLPSLKELLTLVDEAPHFEYEVNKTVSKAIDPNAFAKTPSDVGFWTSTPHPQGGFWTVSFADGSTGQASPGDARYVRCVEYVP